MSDLRVSQSASGPLWFNDVVVFPFDGVEIQDGKERLLGMPKGWQNFTESKPLKGKGGTMALTGKLSGITVLNFDNK